MQIFFAPMQGITDAPFRRAHAQRFSGVDAYFLPFISPTQHDNLTAKELRDIAPEANAGIACVPQILARDAEHFLFAAQRLCDLGWQEVNLNMGCPSGTVTAKGKGAGLLRNLPETERLLDAIFARSPLPISIKTRIGWSDAGEFPALAALLARYPMKMLIVHPRTREQTYGGLPNADAFRYAQAHIHCPIVYNGDLFTPAACRAFLGAHPGVAGVMIGRGLVSNPALARELSGGAPLAREELRDFHQALLDIYSERFSPTAALGRMRELGKHMICAFVGASKPMKQIRKARTLAEYRQAMDALFDAYPLRSDPGFLSDGSKGGHAAAATDDPFEVYL